MYPSMVWAATAHRQQKNYAWLTPTLSSLKEGIFVIFDGYSSLGSFDAIAMHECLTATTATWSC